MASRCYRLRKLVDNCLDDDLVASSCFFADKLVSFSGGSLQDTFLLARVGKFFPGMQERSLDLSSPPIHSVISPVNSIEGP